MFEFYIKSPVNLHPENIFRGFHSFLGYQLNRRLSKYWDDKALEALLSMEDSATQVNIYKQGLNSISKAGDTSPFNLHPENRFGGFYLRFFLGQHLPRFFQGWSTDFFSDLQVRWYVP